MTYPIRLPFSNSSDAAYRKISVSVPSPSHLHPLAPLLAPFHPPPIGPPSHNPALLAQPLPSLLPASTIPPYPTLNLHHLPHTTSVLPSSTALHQNYHGALLAQSTPLPLPPALTITPAAHSSSTLALWLPFSAVT